MSNRLNIWRGEKKRKRVGRLTKCIDKSHKERCEFTITSAGIRDYHSWRDPEQSYSYRSSTRAFLLSIYEIREKQVTPILRVYPTLEKLSQASMKDLQKIEGIGLKRSKVIFDALRE